MVTPHYTFMVLKILGPNGVITIKDNLKKSYACEREGYSLNESQVMQSKCDKETLKQIKLSLKKEELWISSPPTKESLTSNTVGYVQTHKESLARP